MAKVKYNVKGVQRGEFPVVEPGLYQAKIVKVEEGESKSGNGHMIIPTFEILRHKTHKGAKLRTWILTEHEASAFKLAEFIDALGLPEKGGFDTDDILGQRVVIKVDADEYQGKPSARVGTIYAADENSNGNGASSKAKKVEEEPEEEEEEDDPEEEEEEEPDDDEEDDEEEEEGYDEWSVAELKSEIRARRLELPKKAKKTDLVAVLEEDDEESSSSPFDED